MRLRRALPRDAEELARVHSASFPAPWTATDILNLMATPGVFALLAEDAAPFGFILVRAIAGEAEVLTLAVDPRFRRAGAGRALMQAALATAQADGAEAMFLEVAVDNAAAIALYRSLDFETAGRRRGYYRRGDAAVDALLLRRTLNSPAL